MVKNNGVFEEYKYASLVVGGTIIIALIMIFAAARPLYNNLRETSNRVKERAQVKTALEEKLENLKELKTKEAELKEKNAKVLAALPQDKDVSRLFVQFENIAAQSGLAVKRVQESTGTAATSPSTLIRGVTYNVTGVGTGYESLKNSLVKFEAALRLLNISEFSLSKVNDGLDVALTVVTYVRGAN